MVFRRRAVVLCVHRQPTRRPETNDSNDMKTYYFLVCLRGASSRDVRAIGAGSCAGEAFASAAIMLTNAKLSIVSMQNISEAQYYAAVSAPLWSQVERARPCLPKKSTPASLAANSPSLGPPSQEREAPANQRDKSSSP